MLITDPSVCRGLQTLHCHSKNFSLVGDQMLPGREPNVHHSLNKYLLSTDEGPEDPHFHQRQAGSLGLEPHCPCH